MARGVIGRPKGAKNKLTLERERLLAEQIDHARKHRKELAIEVLQRAMTLAEGAAGQHRPGVDAEGKPTGNWEVFGQWYDRWTWVAKELAPFQSPKLKSIEYVMQAFPEAPGPKPELKTVEGKVLDMKDPKTAQQTYFALIKSPTREG